MSWKDTLAQAQEKTSEATELLKENSDGNGNVPQDVEDTVAELLGEAKELRDEAHSEKRQSGLRNTAQGLLDEIERELPSPGRRTIDDPDDARGGGSKGTPPNPNTPPQPQISVKDVTHDLRFGELPKQVNLLIGDLYGSANEYKSRRLAGAAAFNKYIRYGERVLTDDEFMMLKGEPVMTPDQITHVVKQGVPYSQVKETLVEASNVLGGFLVPEDFRTELIKRTAGMTVVRRLARVIPTSRDVVEWPKLAGGNDRYTSAVRVTWVDATPTAGVAQTNPTFGMEKVPVHTVMAETFLGRNMIEDTAVNVTELLQQLFSEAVAIDEDEKFLIGSGVGEPEGILPGGLNSLNLSEVASGNANTVTADCARRMKRAVARQYRRSAAWIMNSETALAFELLKDGNGNYYFDLEDDEFLGKSLYEDESMNDPDAGNYPTVYGDYTGYLVADRVGLTVERYLGSPEARINQVVYVLRRRLGGQLIEPWKFAVLKIAAS